MTLENELRRKKENLKFFYQMAQEALDAKDLEHAIKISAKGLEETEINNGDESKDVLEPESSQDESTKESPTLTPSIMKEDITVIKGVGPSVAEKLRGAGFHTVQSLADAIIPQLTHIPGIGQKTAQKIIEGATSHTSLKSLIDFPEKSNENESEPEIVSIEPEQLTSPQPKFPWFEEKFKIERPGTSHKTKERSTQKYIPEEINDEFSYEEEDQPLEYDKISATEILSQKQYTESLSTPPTINHDLQQKATIEASIEEAYNDSSPKSIQVLEVLQTSEKQSLLEEVIDTLQRLDYHIIGKVKILKKLSKNSDLIAIKVIHANEFLDLVYILPIKLNNFKGEVKVSNEQVKYIPINEKYKENGSSFRLQLNSTIEDLGEVFTVMREDIINNGKLLSYLRTHLQVDISIEQSLMKKNLFFRSGKLQYKLFIEPVLLCNNDVNFLEKRIPFPYLKDINLHVIPRKIFSDFLSYLEKKYYFIEEHSDHKSSLLFYEESFTQFLRNGKKLSLPFIGFGAVMMLLVVFQFFTVLELLINFGYALFGVYTIALVYLYIKFFKVKLEVQTDFTIPAHQKQTQIGDPGLTLINEELTPEMMNQFVYECLGKKNDSKFIHKIEESYAKELLNKKITPSKIDSEPLFETPEMEKFNDNKDSITQEEDEMISKYSSFLED
ncbi:MAG: helix-hairpin-helix domain-containing protein [Promethearchaeota archaeon]|jgi:predicted flap endonuclease-1-like 5' DNA nuclease